MALSVCAPVLDLSLGLNLMLYKDASCMGLGLTLMTSYYHDCLRVSHVVTLCSAGVGSPAHKFRDTRQNLDSKILQNN